MPFVAKTKSPAIGARMDGRPVIQHVEDGCVWYRAVGAEGLPPHTITNVGDGPSRHITIELLGPSASDAPIAREHNARVPTEVASADR